MNAPFSSYLAGIAPGLKELTALLRERFDYVSILSTDSVGFQTAISQRAKSVNRETMTTERGTVVRVYRDGLYSEAALTGFNPDKVRETAESITAELEAQFRLLKAAGVQPYETGKLPDEKRTIFAEMETERLPEQEDLAELVNRLSAISDRGMKEGEAQGIRMIDCNTRASSTHICKLFLTENQDLRQSYVYSEGVIMALVAGEDRTEMSYTAVSGRCGPELFDHMDEKLPEAIRIGKDLLAAEHVVPGEYDVITAPEVTGLIAHEAFGHGVEMDMFVKGRALGADYIGKRVGSDNVTMHEGALCAVDVTSYAFDDEGIPAGDVTEIENGILRAGICDALSALRLGTVPTGNGKRESFSHKAYTRMTNTMFDSGDSTLEEMIASIRKGYLLEGMQSGMEDPKHWGIQCIIDRGYEIIDGKLTGKIVSPLVMTGYVPDLLGSVSMVSRDREVFGAGACGKGHKEWVKVADGGPYLKAKVRLG
ncbi:MAG: TldD/PmbA family protein [Clostridiales bacterium]|nr:TldD/PmbA family protein [Clostridiales bacterium]